MSDDQRLTRLCQEDGICYGWFCATRPPAGQSAKPMTNAEAVRHAGFAVCAVAHLLGQAEWESLRLDVSRAVMAFVQEERERFVSTAEEFDKSAKYFRDRVRAGGTPYAQGVSDGLAAAAGRIREVAE